MRFDAFVCVSETLFLNRIQIVYAMLYSQFNPVLRMEIPTAYNSIIQRQLSTTQSLRFNFIISLQNIYISVHIITMKHEYYVTFDSCLSHPQLYCR